MLGSLASKIFGTANGRRLKSYGPKVAAINALEPEVAALSDEDLAARTVQFRAELAGGKSLDDLLVPAFATVREAAKRVLGQRHFDVQLIGGMVLHEGGISEMRTGEGKTLVATLACYLNALPSRGVHVVTVNDYLARRDAEWMGRVYNFLGLSYGVIVHGLDDGERKNSYAADITYGTNNEFGFDYLRDNMKYELEQMCQRGHAYAIVDEVDSILIDEARTPLIISGPSEDKSDLYNSVDKFVPRLVKEDFEVDEKQRTANLTEAGNEHIEAMLGEAGLLTEGSLYEAANSTLVHHVQQALKAHKLFTLDKDYIVRNGELVIIDEFSGRMMPGRRYSEGLHQALEAKEGVQVQPENVTLASITFQNYFRLYKKLAGMTGTASTEADEFRRDLQARGGRDPDQPAGVAPRRARRGVPLAGREAEGHRQGDRDRQHHHAAHAGGHDVDREVRAARRDDGPGGLPADRLLGAVGGAEGALRRGAIGHAVQALRHPQRPLPRAGGHHRGRGRRARRHHDRHEHGRARHRHQARRLGGDAHRDGVRRDGARPGARREGGRDPGRGGVLQGESD